MRTMRTQLMNIDRLPKQSWFVCADFTGIAFNYDGMDKDSIAISRPKYDQEYEFKRRT